MVDTHCMTDTVTRESARLRALAIALMLAASAACGGKRSGLPTNTANPDRFLYDRGLEELKDNSWLDAREYFRQVVDNYPQSPVRPDAKLGVGDSFLGEKSAESLVLAANEYREFLTFYPAARPRRLRAVQAGDEPLPADARTRARPERDRELRCGSSSCFSIDTPTPP